VTRFAKFARKPKFDGNDKERRKELGKLLRRFRREAHLTQAAVARTLGYKLQSDISNIENTKRTIDPVELETFAHLYAKSLNDFATWRKDQPSTEELRESARHHHTEALEFQRRYYKK
jgi:transcriptional regulator with XRE-family HTH domain